VRYVVRPVVRPAVYLSHIRQYCKVVFSGTEACGQRQTKCHVVHQTMHVIVFFLLNFINHSSPTLTFEQVRNFRDYAQAYIFPVFIRNENCYWIPISKETGNGVGDDIRSSVCPPRCQSVAITTTPPS